MERKNLAKLFGALTVALFSFTAYAQSTMELEMAKEYAKSSGYSTTQINQAVAGLQGTNNAVQTETKVEAVEVDRNEAATDSLNMTNVAAQQKSTTDSLSSDEVFGHNIFKQENLDFVPNYNIPAPKDYRLAAGDEVIIDVWGDVITNISATISPEGFISVPNMGLMYLAGQSVEQAEENIRTKLSKIYSKIDNEPHHNQVKLTLGTTRSVSVSVVGDVARPGSYTVPSLSTIAMVMYMSGGPKSIGSVRNINLYRNNKLVSTFDVYDFLLNGISKDNIRLEDNDIISVAPYDGIVTLEGGVKRPMRYEIEDGETLSDVIKYAGGFSHSAFSNSVIVERISTSKEALSGATAQSFIVNSDEFDSFELKGGDKITVNRNLNRFINRASISGAVWREGNYAIGEGENQASDLYELIEMAGGLRDDAYLKRGYILRYGENRVREQITFSPMDVLLKSSTVEVMPDDEVKIMTIDEVTTSPMVSIAGEVNNPNRFTYRRNMTLGDLIIMAGGVTDGATVANIEIARRILDVENQEAIDNASIVINLNLLEDPSSSETVLSPYDMVFIRKSANYKSQMSVSISGEIKYPGTYVIENNTVRLSDLIVNAGGLNKDAYIYGASLTRIVSAEDIETFRVSQDIASAQDAANYGSISSIVNDVASIAIDLEKAMANPGSNADLVLKEGDKISIPQFDNTVNVTGHIMKQNSIIFDNKMSLKDYISSAGGFQKRAMKRKVYVVQMNGQIAKRGNKDFVITPGSTLVVPEKPERQSISQTLSLASTATTLLIAILAVAL